MSPLVSIIIPCYNYERFIMDCITSCLCQDYQDVEIIVVDDASKDKSVGMAERACFACPEKVRIIRHKTNLGYSAAKNMAIRFAKGKYIRPLDADDMLTTVGISKPAMFLEEHPDVDLVHGICYKLDGGPGYGKALLKQAKLPFDRRCRIHAQGVMYRRSIHERWGLYDEILRSKSDKAMWERLRIVGCNMAKIKSKLAFYRIHNASMLAYRNRHPDYDKKITKTFNRRIDQIKREGLTKENTLWL